MSYRTYQNIVSKLSDHYQYIVSMYYVDIYYSYIVTNYLFWYLIVVYCHENIRCKCISFLDASS